MGAERTAIDALLERERATIEPRLAACELAGAMADGVLVVDTRPLEQRRADGELPGALVVDRNVLEWRLDPTSGHRLPDAGPGRRVVVVCNEGYSSSLAAATLRRLGVDATDLIGGYQAWAAHRHVDGADRNADSASVIRAS